MSIAPILLIASLLLAQKPPSLTFADEFDGSQLDLTRWTPHDPWHPVLPVRAAPTVSEGHLLLNGSLSTFGLFQQTYGRFEIRCRVQSGPGTFARLLLLPVKLAPLPEIEVFKVGSDSSKVFFGNRWGTEQTERSYGDLFDAPDFSAVFHTIAARWDRGGIVWSMDGKDKLKSVDGIPQQPMFLLLEGSIDIDYVRVYQRP